MSLRPYQRDALRASLADYRAGVNTQLWVLPTASGKTEISSRVPKLMKQMPWEQSLFVVPWDDLVWQAADKFKAANPEMLVAVDKAEHVAYDDADVIIASAQTLGKKGKNGDFNDRLKRFNPDAVRTVGIDECHRSLSEWHGQILRYFNVHRQHAGFDKTKLLYGISATPNRTDSRGLEHLFEKISYQIPLRTLMETGPEIEGRVYPYLAPPKAYRVNTEIDISTLKTRKGDFLESDMSNHLDTPERNRMIVDKYQEFGENLPGVCFTINVAHAHHVVEAFTARGIASVVISGDTSRTERLAAYTAYKAGQIKILVSCQALLEGFDMPLATVALLARPSKSTLLYQQMIGRVFRPFPAPEQYLAMLADGERPAWVKPYSILIDFCDLTGNHEIQTIPSLFGLSAKFDTKGEDILKTVDKIEKIAAKQPGLDLKSCESLDDVKTQVDRVDCWRAPVVRPDVKKLSQYIWMELFAGVLQLQVAGGTLEIRQNTLGKYEIWQSKDGLRALKETQDTLAQALTIGDSLVPRDVEVLLKSKAKWREHPPTIEQARLLYHRDPRVKQQFANVVAFHDFAMKRFWSKDHGFTKGGLSQMIDRLKLTKGAAQ
jgi:superfamily II DNA or RNA helicase